MEDDDVAGDEFGGVHFLFIAVAEDGDAVLGLLLERAENAFGGETLDVIYDDVGDDDDADGAGLNPVMLNQGEDEGGDQNQHKNVPEGFQEFAPKRGFAHVEGVFAVGGLALDNLFGGETGRRVNFEGFQGVFDGLIVEISHKASISGGGGFV